MEFSFSDLEQLVRASEELEEEEAEEFVRGLQFLSTPQHRLIFELFSGEPDLVKFMYDNFRAKKNNLHDPQAWEKIVKEEMDFLNAE